MLKILLVFMLSPMIAFSQADTAYQILFRSYSETPVDTNKIGLDALLEKDVALNYELQLYFDNIENECKTFKMRFDDNKYKYDIYVTNGVITNLNFDVYFEKYPKFKIKLKEKLLGVRIYTIHLYDKKSTKTILNNNYSEIIYKHIK
jgi:hypothetical protein